MTLMCTFSCSIFFYSYFSYFFNKNITVDSQNDERKSITTEMKREQIIENKINNQHETQKEHEFKSVQELGIKQS